MTGASGLIGTALVPHLRRRGHDVVRLVRRAPAAADEVRWEPGAPGGVDLAGLGHLDAAVHLAGAGVGDRRWTPAYKREIVASRVDGTTTLARALAAMHPRPAVLVSASAIGFYGDTGERPVDESAPQADTFLAGVVRAWEAAADPARAAGIRVVHPRTGLLLSPRGGALGRLLPLLRLGLGGPLGSGGQFWSWITMADEVAALTFLVERDGLAGPVNLTAPHPERNRDVVAALAHALRRPAVLPVPAAALRLVLGEFAGEVLASQRVLPAALSGAGFTFRHPGIGAAAADLVAGAPGEPPPGDTLA